MPRQAILTKDFPREQKQRFQPDHGAGNGAEGLGISDQVPVGSSIYHTNLRPPRTATPCRSPGHAFYLVARDSLNPSSQPKPFLDFWKQYPGVFLCSIAPCTPIYCTCLPLCPHGSRGCLLYHSSNMGGLCLQHLTEWLAPHWDSQNILWKDAMAKWVEERRGEWVGVNRWVGGCE